MLNIINTIKTVISIGMDFDTVLDIVKGYTTDIDVDVPTADDYGYIVIGNPYGYSLTLDFDDDNRLSGIDFDNGDWD